MLKKGVIHVWWAYCYDSRLWEYPGGEVKWIGGYVNPRGIFIGSDGRVKGCETPDSFIRRSGTLIWGSLRKLHNGGRDVTNHHFNLRV